MGNFRIMFCTAITLLTVTVWSEEYTNVGNAGTFGGGFDEGLLARVYVLDKVALYAGYGYFVIGADSVGLQPLNRFSWKLGGEYLFKVMGRLHLSAFAEWREECYQGQTDIAPGGHSLRYNQWNTLFRAGMRPELFLLKNLSIDFKMGLAYAHHGPTYKLNAAGTSTQKEKNAYDEVGVYCGRAPFFNTDQHVLLNIGLTIYFTNHKKVPDIDTDGDGIVDRHDKCPDKKGTRKLKGCPEIDTDGDGIPDASDKCPAKPGVAENEGCPKAKEIQRGQLILKEVNFETGKAVLLPSSYQALDEVAESFREWPEVRVEVQGHTDNVGTPEDNMILSQKRAEAVRDYLIQKGIAADRLTAVGYGQEKPIADNETSEGRAKNRRVELNRLDK